MFFIGISMLMAGIGRFAYESYSVGVDEVCAELKEKDYQESKEFRNTVLLLLLFLRLLLILLLLVLWLLLILLLLILILLPGIFIRILIRILLRLFRMECMNLIRYLRIR